MEYMQIAVTILVSALFGYLLFRFRLPGGVLIGAILGALLFSHVSELALMPSSAKMIAQVAAGAFIGTSLTPKDLKNFHLLLKPTVIICGSLLILNLVAGTVLHLLCGMELLTALLCCLPGGMSNIPLIAMDLVPDVSPIIFLQFCRMVAGIAIFPSLINRLTRHEPASSVDAPQETAEKIKSSPLEVTAILGTAAVFGWIGSNVGIPAGTLVFSMFGALLFNLLVRPVRIPKLVRRAAQCLSGAYIGCVAGAEEFPSLKRMIIPVILVVAGYFINSLVTSRFLSRWTGISRKESMLMLTPAGASDMALISAEIGISSTVLNLTQIIRMIAAVTIFPVWDLAYFHLCQSLGLFL